MDGKKHRWPPVLLDTKVPGEAVEVEAPGVRTFGGRPADPMAVHLQNGRANYGEDFKTLRGEVNLELV